MSANKKTKVYSRINNENLPANFLLTEIEDFQ